VTRWVWLAVLGWGVGCTTPTEPEPALCDGESPSALTAPARFVLGEAAAYPSDPTIRTRADALETSQRERRALGWDIARRVLEPISVTGLEATHEVPRFQTWYGEEDLRRVVNHVYGARAPGADDPLTEAELDDAFAWNLTSVHEQEAWPADRLAEYIAALDSDEHVRGAGGIERVGYSPSAARHLLRSHPDISRCLTEGAPGADEGNPASGGEPVNETVELSTCGSRTLGPYRVAAGGSFRAEISGDVELTMSGAPDGACTDSGCEVEGPADVELVARPRTATPSTVDVTFDAHEMPFVPCLDSAFPAGSVIIKADYRRVGFGVLLPVHDTSAEALSRLRASDADWADGEELADPGPDAIFTLELPNGNRFRLAALHVMTKELDHWAWATLWWSAEPNIDFGADRPAELVGTPWANYKMCAATWFTERDPDPTGGVDDPSLADALAAVHEGVGGPSWCSNPFLEEGPGNASTNCVGCHQHAGTGLIAEEILELESQGRMLSRLNFPSDYTFAAPEVAALFP